MKSPDSGPELTETSDLCLLDTADTNESQVKKLVLWFWK